MASAVEEVISERTPNIMTWEELSFVDPDQLLRISRATYSVIPPYRPEKALTIGMAAHGNFETTLIALRALLTSVEGNFELILVDDASPDETGTLFELVPHIHPNTKVFRFARNIEYSGSLNTILSHASGEVIIFISNDIFVTPSYIQQLLAVANGNPAAGIVRGCSNFVDNGLVTHSIKDCGDLNNFDALFSYAANRAVIHDGKTLDDQFLTGDAFLVKRRVLDAVGFMDQRFYGYFADHDLGIRARQAGFSPQLALGAFAWHQHGANMDYLDCQARETKVRNRWARVSENWARFKVKYGLPVSMAYQGMRRIPWDGLAAQSIGEKYPPCNHAAHCLPQPGTDAWIRHNVTGMVSQARKLMQAARLDDAERLCQQAADREVNCTEALTQLGAIQVYQGRVAAGIRTFRRAIKLDPTAAKAHSNLLLSMNYAQESTQKALYKESLRWDAMHGTCADMGPPVRGTRSRIRIGYISPDFRRHSVAYFFLPLLERHDRSRFEIFCFSDVGTPDEVTEKMMAFADGWRDISGCSNSEVESVIREVAPDVLVDLAGHTGQVIRLPLFSQRLALVQVSWLGYPNTTGLGAMDYRLTDIFADPLLAGSDQYYSEKLFRLPHGFICYRPPEEAPCVSPLPASANGFVTFGCFNMLPKIQDNMIVAWCEILRLVPSSRLILKNHFFNDVATKKRIMSRFKKNKIADDRLTFLPSDPDVESHLARYGMIDIALDTFPYNGTTTTCEALWMGVPVVTLSGDRHATRVGLSIYEMVGNVIPVAGSIEEYCETACRLASDAGVLSEIRKTLRDRMASSALCDESSFVHDMESFYSSAVKTHGQ